MKEVKMGEDARSPVLAGINKCANAVKVTHGRKGRTVLIREHNGVWRPTKDGVSVARVIFSSDIAEDTGISMVKAAAERTVASAGDGTTCTAILTQAMCNNADKLLKEGISPVEIKKGIDTAIESCVKMLKDASHSILNKDGSINYDIIDKIAMIASNGDSEIGGIVSEVMRAVGPNGMVSVEDGIGQKTSMEKKDGVLVDSGWISQYFITNQPRQRAELDNPYILLYDRKLDPFEPLKNILKQVLETGTPIVIFCEDLVNEALATLVTNKMKGGLKVCVVRCPSFGVQKRKNMEDLAKVVGGVFASEEKGIKLHTLKLKDLGRADKVVVEKDRTMIIGGQGNPEELAIHLTDILAEIEGVEEKDKQALKERYAKLTGGVASIKVGGMTEQEVSEKKDRIDDALCASRAAAEEGFSPGGGVAYRNLVLHKEGISKTENVVYNSLLAPWSQLMKNADINLGEFDLSRINLGINLETNQVENMVDSGIVDPTKVLRVALENAGSIAGMYVMTECTIMPEMK